MGCTRSQHRNAFRIFGNNWNYLIENNKITGGFFIGLYTAGLLAEGQITDGNIVFRNNVVENVWALGVLGSAQGLKIDGNLFREGGCKGVDSPSSAKCALDHAIYIDSQNQENQNAQVTNNTVEDYCVVDIAGADRPRAFVAASGAAPAANPGVAGRA